MTKKLFLYFILLSCITLMLPACHRNANTDEQNAIDTTHKYVPPPVDTSNYFPVTNVIKGEIKNIESLHVNPLLKNEYANGQADSSWVQVKDFENVFKEFITPTIDTANLKSQFEETKFLDQTLNAFTFMYEPKASFADSQKLIRWAVYADADNFKVKRIDITKRGENKDESLMLNWLPFDGYSKETLMKNNADGSATIIKTTTVRWKL